MLIAVTGDVLQVTLGELEALGLTLTGLDQWLLGRVLRILGYLPADARGFCRRGLGLLRGKPFFLALFLIGIHGHRLPAATRWKRRLEPDVLENQPGPPGGEQVHRRSPRSL